MRHDACTNSRAGTIGPSKLRPTPTSRSLLALLRPLLQLVQAMSTHRHSARSHSRHAANTRLSEVSCCGTLRRLMVRSYQLVSSSLCSPSVQPTTAMTSRSRAQSLCRVRQPWHPRPQHRHRPLLLRRLPRRRRRVQHLRLLAPLLELVHVRASPHGYRTLP